MTPSASRQITETVTSWPGVEAGPGRRGEFAFRIGRRELGHLHGDHAAHFSFPKSIWSELFEQGRIVHHPVFPGREGPAARKIASQEDVDDVIALLRLNYERVQNRVPGLVAAEPMPLPFAPDLHVRSFALKRPRGDIGVYGTATDSVTRTYLNHWHEAMFAHTSGPLFVHTTERAEVEAREHHVRGTFTKRHVLDEDFEVVPTPGHTPGATAYLWDTGEHRLLFTGDTIYLDGGQWVAAMLTSSDRDAYIDSLGLIKMLDFDVLVPWAATKGQPYLAHTDRADTARRIDEIVARLRSGGSR